ncbi:hypothetical protein ADU37_CDS08780 [Thermococcus sp. 2319x1]|nr:hypothetical protein ADU37_CDS08780 [Thermococcus sp. 2319x1]
MASGGDTTAILTVLLFKGKILNIRSAIYINDIWGVYIMQEVWKKIFSMMLVVFLVSTFATATPNPPQLTVQVHEQSKTCGQIPTGKAVIVDDLVGVAKEVALRDILRTAEKNSILKEKLKNTDFSKARVKASLLYTNDGLVQRTAILIPLEDNKFMIYVKDIKTVGARIQFERTTYQGVFILATTLKKSKDGNVEPMDGWSPVCTDISCHTDSDCPDLSSQGLYFGQCSCRHCTDYNWVCVAALATGATSCSIDCATCIIDPTKLTCAGCVLCLISIGLGSAVASCCESVTYTCEYYEWWD